MTQSERPLTEAELSANLEALMNLRDLTTEYIRQLEREGNDQWLEVRVKSLRDSVRVLGGLITRVAETLEWLRGRN